MEDLEKQQEQQAQEPVEQKRYFSYDIGAEEEEEEVVYVTSRKPEKILEIIGRIILVCGVITGGYLLLATSYPEVEDYYSSHREFNPQNFAISVGTIFMSVLWWALLKVICEISISLKDMKDSNIQTNA